MRDYREAAELSEKLADKFVEIRALTLFRWKVTGAVAAGGVVAVAVLNLVYGGRVLWIDWWGRLGGAGGAWSAEGWQSGA